MALSYIGLGSNLAKPLEQAITARRALQAQPELSVVACSSLYQSKPMGPQDQPDYLNAVIAVETQLAPLDLLDLTQQIERDHGRERKAERWGPRTLDLDILLYDNLSMNSERLTVPHYGMTQREFVLLPLAEIAPQLSLPDGSQVSRLAESIDHKGLVRFKQTQDWR